MKTKSHFIKSFLIKKINISCMTFVIIGLLSITTSLSAQVFNEPDLPTQDPNSDNSGPDGSLLPPLDGNSDSVDLDSELPDLPPQETTDTNSNTSGGQNTVNENSDIFGGNNNNNDQNPVSNSGSTNGGNPTAGNNSGSNNNSGGNNTSSSTGVSSNRSADSKLVNNFSDNIEWIRTTVDRTLKDGAAGTGYYQFGLKLANNGLSELGLPQVKMPDSATLEKAKPIAQRNVDFLLKLANTPYVELPVALPNGVSNVPGIELLLNSVVNKSAWPRSTYEPLNSEDLEDYESTCHVAFKPVENYDQGKHFKYFASPITSLAYSLMDLPRVALETSRGEFVNNKDGIFKCFKNNKSLGLSPGSLSGEVVNQLKQKGFLKSSPELGFLSNMQLIPQLQAASASDSLCIDFAGNRMPWSANSSKFFSSYRHLSALQQGLDASEFFQNLSGSKRSANSFHNPAALPIAHTIAETDRFFPLVGNFAIETGNSYGMFGSLVGSFIGGMCPTVKEMVEKMNGKGALAYQKGNMIDMASSEYQAWSRWPVFKCGGGSYFRGRQLTVLEQSKNLCQTDSNANPEVGNISKFWDYEEPRIPTFDVEIKYSETKVC